jgi:WD40 repeat protein
MHRYPYRFDAKTGREKQRFLAEYRTPEQIPAGKPDHPFHRAGVFSADGKSLVTSADNWIYVWDLDVGKLRLQIPHRYGQGCNLSLAPDGKTLATSDIFYAGVPGSDTIWLCDIRTGEELLTLESADNRTCFMSFSPDGNRLITGFRSGTAIVWDVSRN